MAKPSAGKATAKKKAAVSKNSKAKVVASSGQKVLKERGKKKQRAKLRRYATMMGSATLALLLYTGYHQRVDEHIGNWLHEQWVLATAEAGLQFQELIVEGRTITPPEKVVQAVGLGIGDSLFLVSLEDIRTNLLTLETVKDAQVGRDLGGRIIVTLTERTPYALWQHDRFIKVIDAEGVVLSGEQVEDYPHLVTVVGDNAPEHMNELVDFLAAAPDMAEKVIAAVLVSDRRWDIHFDSGTQIMLPEINPKKAWEKLAEMQREHGILAQQVEAIDLRIDDKVFITLPEGLQQDTPTGNDV